MADIFISYKAERRAAAEHLCKTLEAHGFTVWFDYGLLSGNVSFRKQIEREIRAASAVIVLWCSMAQESRWVGEEANLALELNSYIGVLIEGKNYPFGYREAHNIDLRNWNGNPRDKALDDLFNQIRKKTAKQPKIEWEKLKEYSQTWETMGALPLLKFKLTERPIEDPEKIITPNFSVINGGKSRNEEGGKAPVSKSGIFKTYAVAIWQFISSKANNIWAYFWSLDKRVIAAVAVALVTVLFGISYSFQHFGKKPKAAIASQPVAASVPKIVKKSKEDLERMAAQCRGDTSRSIVGNVNICYELGNIYVEGALADKNLALAHEFYRLGCREGDSFGSAKACRGVSDTLPEGPSQNLDSKKYLEFACRNGEIGGDFDSCTSMGNRYSYGSDNAFPKDIDLALKYYGYSCALNPGAIWLRNGCEHIGNLYFSGDGVKKNYELALKNYELACMNGNLQGDAHACEVIANMYQNGQGVKKDEYYSTLYLQHACREGADNGLSTSCHEIAYRYLRRKDRDYVNAIKYEDFACRSGKRGGRSIACLELGIAYKNAYGTDQDFSKAKQFFEFGCRNGDFLGNSEACNLLGILYFDGKGVDLSYENAKHFFELACRNGDKDGSSDGCFNLALKYENGQGVTINFANAKRYYELSCRDGDISGNASACNNLGNMFEKSKSDSIVNYASAKKYYEFACRKGNRFGEQLGCNNLGHLYYFGRGVEQSYVNAKQYYEYACRNGDNGGNYGACYKIGEMYEKKQLPNSTITLAINYYQKSLALEKYYKEPKDALIRFGVLPAEKPTK